MITGVILMCALENPDNCRVFYNPTFFETVEECEASWAEAGEALSQANDQWGPVEAFCIEWDYGQEPNV